MKYIYIFTIEPQMIYPFIFNCPLSIVHHFGILL